MRGAVPCLSSDLTTTPCDTSYRLCKWEGATPCADRTMGEGAKRKWEGATLCAQWARARSANEKARRCARIGQWTRARSAARSAARRRAKFSSARGGRRGRVGVGEGAVARGLQSGVVALCSSARVGVGEGAEACSSINFGRPGALLGSPYLCPVHGNAAR